MNNQPTNSFRKYLTKKRLPISIRFTVRKGYSIIMVRIAVNGDEGSSFSAVHEGKAISSASISWNQQQQRAVDRSTQARQFNAVIDGIRAAINAVYDRQTEAGFVPTLESVRMEYHTGTPYTGLAFAKEHKWSAINCYQAYLKELESGNLTDKKLEKTTLSKWGYGLTYLESYVTKAKEENPMSAGSAEELTPF